MNRSDFLKSISIALFSTESMGLLASTPEKVSLKKIMNDIEKKYICKSAYDQSICKFDKKEFGWDKSLTKDLGLDSLDTVELIMNLEKDYDIRIKDEDAEKVKTPRQAAVLVHRYVNAK